MKKKDLLKLIDNIQDEQEIDSLLENSDLAKSLHGRGLTLEAFKEKIKYDKDFRAFIESEKDKYHNKALDTWKRNNLEKELDSFLKRKYPELVTKRIHKNLVSEKPANERKDLLAKAMRYAAEKKFTAQIIEKCLGDDFDSTKVIINLVAEQWKKGLEAILTEEIKSPVYRPGIVFIVKG